MSKKTGILIDVETGKPLVNVVKSNGLIVSGLVVGDVTMQNVGIILKMQKCESKEHPTLGVGINDMAGDENFDEWKRSIKRELSKDGLKINQLVLSGDSMILHAEYE